MEMEVNTPCPTAYPKEVSPRDYKSAVRNATRNMIAWFPWTKGLLGGWSMGSFIILTPGEKPGEAANTEWGSIQFNATYDATCVGKCGRCVK